MIKSGLKRLLRSRGLELIRHPRPTDPDRRRSGWLGALRVDQVLDVGANVGQYAAGLRQHHYVGPIVSFEPIPSVFAKLQAAAAGDERWTCRCVALGAEPGEATIHVAANGGESSSILAMDPAHVAAAPEAGYVGSETIALDTLDRVRAASFPAARSIWLKIDVQGFESSVLEGAADTLRHVVAIEVELSCRELYAGQALMEETIAWLRARGFRPIGFEDVFRDAKSGATLQFSGTFLNAAHPSAAAFDIAGDRGAGS